MWPNPKETAELITFTEEILNGKIDFLCIVFSSLLIFGLINDIPVNIQEVAFISFIFNEDE